MPASCCTPSVPSGPALDAAGYAWRNTVVTAYQNVADVLVALQNDALALRASVDAERASARSLSLASLQYKLGGVSYLSVLTAQQSYQNASLSLLRSRALRYTRHHRAVPGARRRLVASRRRAAAPARAAELAPALMPIAPALMPIAMTPVADVTVRSHTCPC